jgi:hypothetical protein
MLQFYECLSRYYRGDYFAEEQVGAAAVETFDLLKG